MLKSSNKILKDILFKLRRNYKVIFLNVISLVGMILLGINIYRVLSIGMQRYSLILMEKQSLDQLKEEEGFLENDLKFYSSLDFIESQSRDFLSLAHKGDLVLVIPDVNEKKETAISGKSEQRTSSEPSINLWIELLF